MKRYLQQCNEINTRDARNYANTQCRKNARYFNYFYDAWVCGFHYEKYKYKHTMVEKMDPFYYPTRLRRI